MQRGDKTHLTHNYFVINHKPACFVESAQKKSTNKKSERKFLIKMCL